MSRTICPFFVCMLLFTLAASSTAVAQSDLLDSPAHNLSCGTHDHLLTEEGNTHKSNVPQTPEEADALLLKDSEISVMVVYTSDAKWGAFHDATHLGSGDSVIIPLSYLIERCCRWDECPSGDDEAEFKAYCESPDITAPIENEILDSMDYLNEAFANSGTRASAVLVHSQEINRQEDPDIQMDTHLDWIMMKMNGNKAYKKNIYNLRETYQADIVSLWIQDATYNYLNEDGTPKSFSSGVARFPSNPGRTSVNVVSRYNGTRKTPTKLFAHEVGHNLGLRHDRYVDKDNLKPEEGGVGDYEGRRPYGHAYVDLEHGFRTIMSYDDKCDDADVRCEVIPYFSNPNILTEDGHPVGRSTFPKTNNAKVIRKNWRWIANFRNSAADLVATPGANP